MGDVRSAADSALGFLQALQVWEIRLGRMAHRFEGRRAGARLTEDLGELRRATALLAISATELTCPPDPDIARERLAALMVRLRATGALDWSDLVEIVNDAAETPPPKH